MANGNSEERRDTPHVDEAIGVGVKVFIRSDQLKELLSTIPSERISTVYVADDGSEDHLAVRKEQIYDSEYPFSLRVLDLEYDSGVGYGRQQIVTEFTEEYLLMLDSDIRVPNNVGILVDILNARPELGGVSGCLVEPHSDRIAMMAADFEEDERELHLSPFLRKKRIEFVEGYPLVEFDFIPNVALFRRECLQDYSWDPIFEMEFDHQDFYLGHWKGSDWSFAVCPQVNFPHYPGGDDEYLSHRWGESVFSDAEDRFFRKWDYDKFVIEDYYWYEGGRSSVDRPTLSISRGGLSGNRSLFARMRRNSSKIRVGSLADRSIKLVKRILS